MLAALLLRKRKASNNPGIPDPGSLTYVIHNRVMIIVREGVSMLSDIYFFLKRNVIHERDYESSQQFLDIGYCICLCHCRYVILLLDSAETTQMLQQSD